MNKKIILYLLTLSLVVGISYAALLLPSYQAPSFAKVYNREKVTSSKLPTTSENITFPTISAQGALAIDIESGVSLYEKNADNKFLPASTTKIMTALVALDIYKLDQVITIPKISVVGQKMNLVMGEKMTMRNLLFGLLVFSANDAAEALATLHPQGREKFIELMNQKAHSLNLSNTNFVNPTGLDNSQHYSSARDMVRLSEVAMRESVFAQIVGTKSIVVKSIDERFSHSLRNINELLGKVEGVVGVKTGWTENARENLVTQVNRDNKKILIAVLGSQDRFGETKELIEWIYKNTTWNDLSYAPSQ